MVILLNIAMIWILLMFPVYYIMMRIGYYLDGDKYPSMSNWYKNKPSDNSFDTCVAIILPAGLIMIIFGGLWCLFKFIGKRIGNCGNPFDKLMKAILDKE